MQKCSLEQSWFLCLDLQVSFLKIMQLETKFSFIRFFFKCADSCLSRALSSKLLLMHYKQIFWLVAVDSDGFDIGLVGRINQKTPNSCYVVIVSV